MLSKKLFHFVLLFCNFLWLRSQDCNLTLKGKVLDESSEFPLAFVNIYIQEEAKGAVSDAEGNFEINKLCPGEYHLSLSHIGCESINKHIVLTKDTFFTITLNHNTVSTNTIIIQGTKNNTENQAKIAINRNKIEDASGKSISTILENETGVELLKNGSSIAKPVVHGLYGNRLLILNHGVIQSGQQWGNDHSPEIDLFSADNISVLKGVSAIEYGGGNLGSMVLVQAKHISKEPHLHGQVNYTYESNGNGQNLNIRLEQNAAIFAWRVSGSLKKYGDKRSSSYFLTNTGSEEANLNLQIEKSWKEKSFLEFYISTFNTKIGILKGSHIGNLSDLEESFERNVPFFTKKSFSYKMAAPKQHVSHHLAKLKVKFYFRNKQEIESTIAGQIDLRKEFDVRRGGRTETPAMSLSQYAINTNLKYKNSFTKNWILSLGNQYTFTNNVNNPKTGILPLIPDYFLWKIGIYGAINKSTKFVNLNLGLRYDFEQQLVASISKDIPRKIIRYNKLFNNVSSIASLKFKLTKTHSLTLNSGFAMRNPAINELYSYGLHQGVSGIEEGDVNLKPEKALKTTLEYEWKPSNHFSLNTLAYYQYFKNYIFLNPQGEYRLTIRGAFPLFKYEQTNAHIYGIDFGSKFNILNALFGVVNLSFIRGDNLKEKIPLVYIPQSNIYGSLAYRILKPLKVSKKAAFHDLEFEINNKFFFKQAHLLPSQDFLPPPKAYNLFGLKISTNVHVSKYKIRLYISAENLFNITYRNYLNRLRYYSNDEGISVRIGIAYKF